MASMEKPEKNMLFTGHKYLEPVNLGQKKKKKNNFNSPEVSSNENRNKGDKTEYSIVWKIFSFSCLTLKNQK